MIVNIQRLHQKLLFNKIIRSNNRLITKKQHDVMVIFMLKSDLCLCEERRRYIPFDECGIEVISLFFKVIEIMVKFLSVYKT